MILQVKGLTKAFGGIKAVDDVSFSVSAGTVHSVIGPNGAGKTTLLNLITGLYQPSAGEVEFAGSNISAAAPEQLAKLGMSRTFQNLQVCMNMSAVENVMLGAHLQLNANPLAGMLRLGKLRKQDEDCRQRARQWMEFVGLDKQLDVHASQLSYGALKRLEIARALAANPKLLLLDEPAAGLNPSEKKGISALISRMVSTGITVIMVEHDMKMVMSLSDHIFVLDYGRRLAEGTAAEIRSNSHVIAAYLGASN